MIKLTNNELVFSFPEIHPHARMSINFQRTMRIPDDDNDYPLPPGLGCFPLEHIDNHRSKAPKEWIKDGGVMLPMYQSEAMWLSLDSDYISENDNCYPFAVKICTGKIDAVTGEELKKGVNRRPQNYLVVPEQPWLDGYCVEKGIIRQFVAMPLGSGYSAEEQISGKAEHGGIQITVYPMKRKVFDKRFPQIVSCNRNPSDDSIHEDSIRFCVSSPAMGIAPGGRMKQDICDDPYNIKDWDMESSGQCSVHIANSLVWRSITGLEPPTTPPTAAEYTNHGLPWFDYYNDTLAALDGAAKLNKLKSVKDMGKEKGDNPLPENESVDPDNIVTYIEGMEPNQVRECELA